MLRLLIWLLRMLFIAAFVFSLGTGLYILTFATSVIQFGLGAICLMLSAAMVYFIADSWERGV